MELVAISSVTVILRRELDTTKSAPMHTNLGAMLVYAVMTHVIATPVVSCRSYFFVVGIMDEELPAAGARLRFS